MIIDPKKISISITGYRLTKVLRCTCPKHQPAHAYCHSGSLHVRTYIPDSSCTQHMHAYIVLVTGSMVALWLLRMGSTSWVALTHDSLQRDLPESACTSQDNHTQCSCTCFSSTCSPSVRTHFPGQSHTCLATIRGRADLF